MKFLTFLAFAALSCRHESPGPAVRPPPRESPPLAPRPEALPPGVLQSAPDAPCPDATACPDGGIPMSRAAERWSSRVAERDDRVVPARAAVDAGVDSTVRLPPI